MSAWTAVRCPVCDKILFEAVGIFAHSLIRIYCRCKRIVEVGEGLLTQVVQEQQPTNR